MRERARKGEGGARQEVFRGVMYATYLDYRPLHSDESRKIKLITKTEAAVKDRLTKGRIITPLKDLSRRLT